MEMDTIEDNRTNGITQQEALANLKGCIDAAVQRGLMSKSEHVVLLHESYTFIEQTLSRLQAYREIDAKLIGELREQVKGINRVRD